MSLRSKVFETFASASSAIPAPSRTHLRLRAPPHLLSPPLRASPFSSNCGPLPRWGRGFQKGPLAPAHHIFLSESQEAPRSSPPTVSLSSSLSPLGRGPPFELSGTAARRGLSK